ncbi:ExbD/TolR family protein [Serratia ficaria]|uniref:ExbD/TolR family protein n=1 Tax=Serratia ficaria TaxID=61651 RepID=UPI00217C018B|nr:biopolymer transporter ExbD [Serratia ficaria]CAI1200685.1 Biopolymer transport protein exbD [Serratia ficaria]CAI2527487.1 Biopolymer transport protein exbD [Serratia ficaria]CAI2536285.1 Biopolymer transport protein exbD [Serratia ficaria]
MMAFSNHQDDDVLSEMNVTPLVDVMLVLLVVFIVTAPLLTNAIPLKLPKTGSVAPPNQPKPLVVSVDRDGNYYIERQRMTLAEVGAAVSGERKMNQQRAVQLLADEQVVYGRVAQAMAVIQKAGVTRLAVITDAGG